METGHTWKEQQTTQPEQGPESGKQREAPKTEHPKSTEPDSKIQEETKAGASCQPVDKVTAAQRVDQSESRKKETQPKNVDDDDFEDADRGQHTNDSDNDFNTGHVQKMGTYHRSWKAAEEND